MRVTRRNFVCAAAAGTAAARGAEAPLIVPLRRVMNSRAQCTPEEFRRFWWSIWPEAMREFGRCGIRFECGDAKGEIRLSPGGRPIFTGLERGIVNLVVTDYIPMTWDNGRALAGVTGLHEGYCVCVMALKYAHGNQFPFVSVNTCVHELLHVLLGDVFVRRPTWYQGGERESRIDWYATRLWVFQDGGGIRKRAEACVKRLRAASAPLSD